MGPTVRRSECPVQSQWPETCHLTAGVQGHKLKIGLYGRGEKGTPFQQTRLAARPRPERPRLRSMIDADKVRAISLSLPDVEDRSYGMLRFSVRGKQFAWSYLERTALKRARQPRLDVLAVRCATAKGSSLRV